MFKCSACWFWMFISRFVCFFESFFFLFIYNCKSSDAVIQEINLSFATRNVLYSLEFLAVMITYSDPLPCIIWWEILYCCLFCFLFFYFAVILKFGSFAILGIWITPYAQQLFWISEAVCCGFLLSRSLLSGSQKHYILPTGKDNHFASSSNSGYLWICVNWKSFFFFFGWAGIAVKNGTNG